MSASGKRMQRGKSSAFVGCFGFADLFGTCEIRRRIVQMKISSAKIISSAWFWMLFIAPTHAI